MPPYSPFDKPLERLQPTDLAALHDTKEGWYVEYKSELIPARSLAKSLSAFANTYGGWLFLGVKEESKTNSVAGGFPGIHSSDVDALLQRLRHSIAEHVNPPPFFNSKVLRGPCPVIGLEADFAVIAVEVPQSLTTPHVHKDGRIYRRVADGSEPVPETDRFILDQLWRRDRPIRRIVRRWIKRDPEFSKAEQDIPYVRVLLCVDPWRQKPMKLDTGFEQIRDVLTSRDDAIVSIPYDTVYTTAEGFLARQVSANDPGTLALTWRMSRDLIGDVIIPLPYRHAHNPSDLRPWLRGYAHSSKFIDLLQSAGYTTVKVADLNLLMNILIATASKYRRLLCTAGVGGQYYSKARVLNAWRLCPFVDVESALDRFATHGIPMLMNDTVSMPAGDDPDSFLHVFEPKVSDPENHERVSGAVQAIRMFTVLARAFGIRSFVDRTSGDQKQHLYTELMDAGSRALLVQANRKQ